MESVKKQRLEKLALERKGAEVLEEIEKNNIDVLSKKTKKPWVDALLTWYGIEVMEACRLIADRREKWAEVRSTDPPTYPQ